VSTSDRLQTLVLSLMGAVAGATATLMYHDSRTWVWGSQAYGVVWTAIGSIGTVGTVVMALLPLLSQDARLRRQRRAIRARLMPSLATLGSLIHERTGPNTLPIELRSEEMEAATAVEALVEHAHLLEDPELLALTLVSGLLRGARAFRLDQKRATALYDAIIHAVRVLRAHGAPNAADVAQGTTVGSYFNQGQT